MLVRAALVIVLLLAAGAAVFAVAGARSDDEPEAARAPSRAPRPTAPQPAAAPPPTRPRPSLQPARCPAGVAGCRSVRGRVVYVESVDPDGDGDLHVVIAGGSVTLPGFTAVDVRIGLRPRTDPRIGSEATAAGPVQRGSRGQSQIHALEFRVR